MLALVSLNLIYFVAYTITDSDYDNAMDKYQTCANDCVKDCVAASASSCSVCDSKCPLSPDQYKGECSLLINYHDKTKLAHEGLLLSNCLMLQVWIN